MEGYRECLGKESMVGECITKEWVQEFAPEEGIAQEEKEKERERECGRDEGDSSAWAWRVDGAIDERVANSLHLKAGIREQFYEKAEVKWVDMKENSVMWKVKWKEWSDVNLKMKDASERWSDIGGMKCWRG